LVEVLRARPGLRDVSSDQQDQGLPRLAGHRTAARLRAWAFTPQLIDDTLYDSFGQRQVSTIFTQLNQYRCRARGGARFSAPARRSPSTSTSAPPPAGRCRSPAVTR